MATTEPAPRAGTVEVLVGLLAELEEATESGVFYDRVCRAVCSLTTMRRAAVLLYDDTYRAVIPAGSFGVDPELAKRIEGTLDETPLARKALEEDRVIEVRGELSGHVPSRYAGLADTACITCTPISAARRWLGVIFADREGEDFQLDDGERETMMTLGRMAALTASVERSTEQRESERRPDRTGRADPRPARERDPAALRRRAGTGIRARALGHRAQALPGRAALGGRRPAPRADPPAGAGAARPRPASRRCSSGLLERRPEMRLRWEDGVEVPADLEPLAQSVLAEALRNADRHAHPTWIEVRVASTGDTFSLAIQNDGARDDRATKGGGLGLRLAALEALRYEGLVEFGAPARRPLAGPARRPGRGEELMAPENGGLRVLVVDDHDVVQWGFRLLLERQSWVERCLAASDGAEAVEVCAKVQTAGRAGRHAARLGVRSRRLRGDPQGEPEHPGAADLRRRGDLAQRRPRRRRLRLHLQGLVRGRRRQGGADGLAGDRGLRRPGADGLAAVGARAGGPLADRDRARPTKRSPAICTSPRTP